MAEKLESFEFGEGGGRDRSPQLDQWLDGGIYKLVLGEDCGKNPVSARQNMYAAAVRRGKKVRVHVGDGFLIVQARDGKGSDAS